MMRALKIMLFGYAGSLLALSTGLAWIPYALVGLVVLKAMMEPSSTHESMWTGMVLGFFLDIFSGNPRGIWIAGIGTSIVLVKYLTQSYVRLWSA